MKFIKKIFWAFLLITVLVLGYGAWILFGSKTSNPNNYKTIGDIPSPWGYECVSGEDVAYTDYLRNLPLKGRGLKVQLYAGDDGRF